MSFGFSVGDFLSGATLIKDIISALRGSAKLEYRELELELYGLQRALAELEHLQSRPDQEASVNAVKAAALMCRYPLEEFQAKLKRYQLFSRQEGHRKRDIAGSHMREVQWTLSMPDEIVKLRAYIAAHVGSLNMRLLTLGLTTMTIAREEASDRDDFIRNELAKQLDVLTANTTKCGAIYTLVTNQIVPQLQSLASLVEKVWSTNLQIIAFFSSLQNNQSRIDIRHTWFQEPLCLEDAFGRTIPIPVEYGWSKFQAIVNDQFSRGPGKEKVFAGEYEIFKTDNSSQVINLETFSLLAPGTAITMAMVIGKYSRKMKDQCPKPDCQSKTFSPHDAGGLVCVKCKVWFARALTALPRPWRLLSTTELKVESSLPLKNDCNQQQSGIRIQPDVFKAIREERKWYKNIRIHSTDTYPSINFLETQNTAGGSLKTRIQLEEEVEWTQRSTNSIRDIVRKIVAEELRLEELGLKEYGLQDGTDLICLGLDSFIWFGRIAPRLQKALQVDDLRSWGLAHFENTNVHDLSEDLGRVCSSKEQPYHV